MFSLSGRTNVSVLMMFCYPRCRSQTSRLVSYNPVTIIKLPSSSFTYARLLLHLNSIHRILKWNDLKTPFYDILLWRRILYRNNDYLI